MTLEEYLAYDDGAATRYELVDGVLVDMGAESTINTQIAAFLLGYFIQLGIPAYRLGIKQRLQVHGVQATVRDPDLIVHSEASEAAIRGASQALLKWSDPPPLLIVEVVSPGKPGEPNYDRDYIEKRQEYAARGVTEYWLADPNLSTVKILVLDGDLYREIGTFCNGDRVVSSLFPQLAVTATEILNAGRC